MNWKKDRLDSRKIERIYDDLVYDVDSRFNDVYVARKAYEICEYREREKRRNDIEHLDIMVDIALDAEKELEKPLKRARENISGWFDGVTAEFRNGEFAEVAP